MAVTQVDVLDPTYHAFPSTFDDCSASSWNPVGVGFESATSVVSPIEVGDLVVFGVAVRVEWFGGDPQTKNYTVDVDDPCGVLETKPLSDPTVLDYTPPPGWTTRQVFRHYYDNGSYPEEFRLYVHTRKVTVAGQQTLDPANDGAVVSAWAPGQGHTQWGFGWVLRGAGSVTTDSAIVYDAAPFALGDRLSVPDAGWTTAGATLHWAAPFDDLGSFTGDAAWNESLLGDFLTKLAVDTDGTSRVFPTAGTDQTAIGMPVWAIAAGPVGGGWTLGLQLGGADGWHVAG